MSYPQQDMQDAITEGLEDHLAGIRAARQEVFAWTLLEEVEQDPMYFHAVQNALRAYDGLEKQTISNILDICTQTR